MGGRVVVEEWGGKGEWKRGMVKMGGRGDVVMVGGSGVGMGEGEEGCVEGGWNGGRKGGAEGGVEGVLWPG